MPVGLSIIRSSNALVIKKICDHEGCDREACLGVGVKYFEAIRAAERGDKKQAKRLLGKWYCCAKHLPVTTAPN
jgi:hypothetical protein